VWAAWRREREPWKTWFPLVLDRLLVAAPRDVDCNTSAAAAAAAAEGNTNGSSVSRSEVVLDLAG